MNRSKTKRQGKLTDKLTERLLGKAGGKIRKPRLDRGKNRNIVIFS